MNFACLCILILVNLVHVYFFIVPDCDEVYNYWEPFYNLFSYGSAISQAHTHHSKFMFIRNRPGFQPWEYAGQYHLRSYSVLVAFYIFIKLLCWVRELSSIQIYYVIRTLLALFTAIVQYHLLNAFEMCSRNRRVIYIVLTIMTFSTGSYISSSAFLPNTFSMIFNFFALAAFLKLDLESFAFWGIMHFWFGWPYAILTLIIPGVYLIIYSKSQFKFVSKLFGLLRRSFAYFLLQGIFCMGVDFYMYESWVIPPLDAIKYNVFGINGSPLLYGSEGPFFYVFNFLLNFNIAFMISIIGVLFMALEKRYKSSNENSTNYFILWISFITSLFIYSLQSHKEERFMYCLYPFMIVCCGFGFHELIVILEGLRRFSFSKQKHVYWVVLLVFICLSLSRSTHLYGLSKPPMNLYRFVNEHTETLILNRNRTELNIKICQGLYWHMFPSHFLVPSIISDGHEKEQYYYLISFHFLKTGTGYLPVHYSTTDEAFKRKVPELNSQAIEDISQYINIHDCDYIIDSNEFFASKSMTHWKPIHCERMMNKKSLRFITRWLYIPFLTERIASYDEFCLWKR